MLSPPRSTAVTPFSQQVRRAIYSKWRCFDPRLGLNPVQGFHAQEGKAFPHGDARGFAEQQPAALLVRTQHSAVGDEVGELGRQGVEVLAETVGTEVVHASLAEAHERGWKGRTCQSREMLEEATKPGRRTTLKL